MEKICPCCSNSFRCRVDRIEFCNCRKITLAKGVRDYIKETYAECVCLECLKTINENFNSFGVNPKHQSKKVTSND